MSDPQGYRHRDSRKPAGDPGREKPLWPSYLGITASLLLMLAVLGGGIIWYNSKKSSDLAIAAGHRLMQEAEDKITDRIKLLYDPMYAIVGISSMVPELTSPSVGDDPRALALLLRALRIYPQIQSIYVGFDNGGFHMVTHIIGEKSAALRAALHAPADAAFASEIITAGVGGNARWVFLADDGVVVGRGEAAPFDPRQRSWYKAAKRSDIVEESDLYIFASSGEPGFTLSRSFGGATPGVMGADLAAVDLSFFLRSQQITPSSTAFIFTTTGKVVATPNPALIAKAVHAEGENQAMPPRIADLNDPVIGGLVAAYQDHQMAGTRIYDVAGRTYIGRVVAIPARYGRDQLLAMMVPVDEIVQPIADIRNETLLYSIAFLVFAVPLYVTLVVAWVDRRLGRRMAWSPRFRDDE